MTRGKQTSLPDAFRAHTANAIKRHGNTREVKRLERTLPAQNNRKETK